MSQNDQQTTIINEPKGRPMLHWVGKRPLDAVTIFPAQQVERFDPATTEETGNLLFHGDNKDVLAWLLANGYRGQVKLVYIDPPFDSGADYVRQVQLRGIGTAKIKAEQYTLGEQIQYTDIWVNDTYLQFMYERLLLLRELLSDDGSIALHCDSKRSHYLRMLLEEVFGAENFRSEIIVRTGVKNVQSQFEEMSSLTLGNNIILLFSKSTETKYRKLQTIAEDYEPGKWDTFWRGTNRPTMRYSLFGQSPDHGQWRWSESRTQTAIANYEEYQGNYSSKFSLDDYYLERLEEGEDLDFVRLSPDDVVQYYVAPRKYRLLNNVWLDIPYRGTVTDYPTEKNEAIVLRLVEWITDPTEIVCDSFTGSGTTAAVAQKLGRRWIASDINKGAIQTTAKRLQTIIREQIEAANTPQQAFLKFDDNDEEAPPLASLAFTLYRVNDYDLTLQYNEAADLAIEHIGIERLRTDSFFDGTLGRDLVKIIPFNHPLTLLDLQTIVDEVHARPQEERNITVVSLGKESSVDPWLAEYNKRRPVNQIRHIELRTDEKYGKFFVHQPAQADVTIRRDEDQILVEIEDFISPTIVERLEMDTPLLKAHIPDWRAMVDVVLIDTAYDGELFNISLSDVPERKNDLVAGSYQLPAPAEETAVAVKIIDMLGEELLVVETL
jgi:DNA modification methylase